MNSVAGLDFHRKRHFTELEDNSGVFSLIFNRSNLFYTYQVLDDGVRAELQETAEEPEDEEE